MDYLMVPTSASPIEKQDQDILTHGKPEPATTPGPGTLLDLKPEPTIVMPAAPAKNIVSKKPSVTHKTRRSSKVASSQIKQMGKSSQHRHHRRQHRYRHIMFKELLTRSWKKIHPCLVYLRKVIYELTQSFLFEFFICTVVAINTILLVIQTFAVVEIRGEWFFSALDPIFLCVYVVEAILKLIALDFKYFRDPWNDIDFFIMFMTVLEFILVLYFTASQGNRGNTLALFRVLKIIKGIRAIRAIRVLLTLRVTENLQEITGTFILSFQSIGAIILLMFSFLFMSSVVLCDIFHEADQKHFGDLFKTIFTLFQLFTLDDWSMIYLTCHAAGAWYIIIFLIIYILVEYFLLLNLVIAVLVDNFQMSLLKRQEKKRLKQKIVQLKDSTTEDSPMKQAEKTKLKELEEETLFRKMVMEKYGSLVLNEKEWLLLYNYFQIMTAIDNSQQQFQSQASTTDKILDTFFEGMLYDQFHSCWNLSNTSEEDYFPK